MQCCSVYNVIRETVAPSGKVAPSDKELISIFILTKAKRPTSGGQYANVSC